MQSRPLAKDIVTDEAHPRLMGARDRTSGRIVFPHPTGSERERFDAVALSRTGSVWSWTVQRFRPKTPPYAGPEDFVPFIMAYVELPGETIVATRLVEIAIKDVAIGLPVEMVLIPLDPALPHEGLIPAFRPTGVVA